jgi:hypothetical protein
MPSSQSRQRSPEKIRVQNIHSTRYACVGARRVLLVFMHNGKRCFLAKSAITWNADGRSWAGRPCCRSPIACNNRRILHSTRPPGFYDCGGPPCYAAIWRDVTFALRTHVFGPENRYAVTS